MSQTNQEKSPQRLDRSAAMAYLVSLQEARPQHSEWILQLKKYYEKFQYHQITVKLFEFIENGTGDKDLLGLYQNFIAEFEMRMDPLSLAEFASKVVIEITCPDQRIHFVESIKPKVKQDKLASILCSILCGEQLQIKGDLAGVERLLEEISSEIDDVDGVSLVHSRYYLLASDHYKLIGNHCKYYRNTLRYLGCLYHPDELKNAALSGSVDKPSSQRPFHPAEPYEDRAFTLSLAALLGDEIFNFGELLQHPIINYIDESKRWVVSLLEAFNFGDLEQYEALRPYWQSQPDLASHELDLRKKISLLCLMEMTFKSLDGVLTFESIATQARVGVDEVEMLVMRALSLGLVKGTIDQVAGNVHLSWVQPRVLNKVQIESLRNRLVKVGKDVKVIQELLENKAQEIIS